MQEIPAVEQAANYTIFSDYEALNYIELPDGWAPVRVAPAFRDEHGGGVHGPIHLRAGSGTALKAGVCGAGRSGSDAVDCPEVLR